MRPSAPLAFEAMPHARLVDQLREAVERARAAGTPPARLHALLDAVVAVTTDLDLQRMLKRIVDSACQLTGARSGRLDVLDESGAVCEHIRASSPDPRPAEDQRDDVRLPVNVNDSLFGHLRVSGKGQHGLTAEDIELLTVLTAAAGVAIGNARMLATTARRQRWLEAAAEITDVLLEEDVETSRALQIVARRARELLSADLAFVALRQIGSDSMRVEVADGMGADILAGYMLPPESLSSTVTRTGKYLVIDDIDADERAYPVPPMYGLPPFGPGVVVPLSSGHAVHGVLAVVSYAGNRTGFGPTEAALAQAFGAQAALALDRTQAQEERRLLAVLEERDRIARDLHDVVIQRLFGAGLKLQRAARLSGDAAVVERVEDATDDLDATIHDIRDLIFQLHHRERVTPDLRSQITMLIKETTSALGFAPVLTVEGPVDAVIAEDVGNDLLAVLREALSNVTRHAHASSVDVRLEVREDILLTVADDGIGAGLPQQGTGLRTMRERAERHDGSFSVRTSAAGGTVVQWRVPGHRAVTPAAAGLTEFSPGRRAMSLMVPQRRSPEAVHSASAARTGEVWP